MQPAAFAFSASCILKTSSVFPIFPDKNFVSTAMLLPLLICLIQFFHFSFFLENVLLLLCLLSTLFCLFQYFFWFFQILFVPLPLTFESFVGFDTVDVFCIVLQQRQPAPSRRVVNTTIKAGIGWENESHYIM